MNIIFLKDEVAMTKESNNIPHFEILLIDEFAERLKVGRSTIWTWKKDGTLVPGHHYIQKGKVLRFIWSRDLILDLHGLDLSKTEPHEEIGIEKKHQTNPRQKVGINLDY